MSLRTDQGVFDEAHHRDPRHERVWVVLIDGSASQREQVLAEARQRGVRVGLVLDRIHARNKNRISFHQRRWWRPRTHELRNPRAQSSLVRLESSGVG